MATPQQVEALIRQTAQQEGAADLADVLVAIGINETGLSPETPGDYVNGRPTSFGVFHENDGGRGRGLTREQREDVPAATRRLIAEFRAVAAKPENRGKDLGTLAVLTQRPAETHRPGYIQRVNQYLTGRGVPTTASPGTAQPAGQGGVPVATRTSLPAGYTGRGGGDVPMAVRVNQVSPGNPLAGASAGGSAWPLVGGKVSNQFGGKQGRSPGMTGPLPSSNVGVDIGGVPEGSAVTAPVSGTVVRVHQSQGTGNPNENGGYGGMVLLKGNDGYFHRLSHLQGGSVSVKQGDTVKVGQAVGKVGATGNTMGGGGGPYVHLDWEKFTTRSGNPEDRDGMAFADPTTAGTAAGGQGGQGVSNTAGTRLDPSSPEYQTKKQAAIKAELDKDSQLQDYKTRVSRAEAELAKDDEPLKKAREDLEAFNKAHPEFGGKAPPNWRPKPGQEGKTALFPFPGAVQAPDGRWYGAGQVEANPLYKEYTAAKSVINKYENEVEGVTNKDKERLENNWKLVQEERKLRDSRVEEITNRIGAEFDADQDRIASTSERPLVVDPTSGLVLGPDGKPVYQFPRDAKPGETFDVPGKGRYILEVGPDGKWVARELVPAANKDAGEWKDAGDRLVQVGPDGRETGRVINKGVLGDKPTVLGGADGPYLTIWNPFTGKIDKVKNEGFQEKPPTQVTAPKDASHIVRQGPDGKLIVEDNPAYDPSTRDVTGVSTISGKVYRVKPDGTATITDTLTPEERAVYDKGKLAELEGKGADTATKIIDAATKLRDAELKRRQQEIWERVQAAANDPNVSPDDIMGIIQSGAKDAEEWTKILDAHVRQKTAEETARANKAKEGIDIQNADRMLREGLYKDINETRAQRTNAQRAANEAIAGSGIIGEANSMNVLSAMAPQVGSDGIKRAGTIGLGVGAGAITPVQKTWEEHQAELQKLRDQMPSVRMADPNVKGPSFSMPRPKPGLVPPPVPGGSGVAADLEKIARDNLTKLLGGSGANGTAKPAEAQPAPTADPSVAHPAPQPAPTSAPIMGGQWGTAGPTPTEAGDPNAVGGSFDTTPGRLHIPAGIGTLLPEEERDQPVGVGGGGYSKPRFRAPRPKRRAA